MVRHNVQAMTSPAAARPTEPATDADGWRATFRLLPKPVRVSVYVVIGLVLVVVAGTVAVVVLGRQPLPQTSGELEVAGLESSVTVVRDEHGIPQLYGDSVADLMRAQGFVHAQERFFEMDVRRHVTSGRLSELFGEATVETDTFIRTLGWREVAEREVALLDPDTRAAFEAYADGVNAYLDQRSPTELALEYTALRATGLDYEPEPWTTADSLAWLKAMAWDLRGNMTDEIDRVLALSENSPERVAELYPAYDGERFTPIVSEGAVVDGVFDQNATGGTRFPQRPPYLASPEAVSALARVGDRRARCRRSSAWATGSAATAGSSTASTPRPVRRSSPTTRTSA